MVYRYLQACIDEGLDTEQIQAIDRYLNASYHKLARENQSIVKKDYKIILISAIDNLEKELDKRVSQEVYPTPEEYVLQEERRDYLRSFMTELSENERLILSSYYGMPHCTNEILAQKLGCSNSTIRYQKNKAIQTLRRRFKEAGFIN